MLVSHFILIFTICKEQENMQTAEDIQLLIQELELKNRFLLSENRRLEEKLAK